MGHDLLTHILLTAAKASAQRVPGEWICPNSLSDVEEPKQITATVRVLEKASDRAIEFMFGLPFPIQLFPV